MIPLIAAVSGSGLLTLLVQLIIAGLIFYALVWFVRWLALPEPFSKILLALVGLAAIIFLVNLLMGLGGQGFIQW
jgi:hypothetical protein